MRRFVFAALLLTVPLSHGWTQGVATASPTDSSSPPKRFVFNLSYPWVGWDYATINYFLEGGSTLSPGSAWSTGTPIFNSAILDAHGYPTIACGGARQSACRTWSLSMTWPSSFHYGSAFDPDGKPTGQYFCMQGRGDGHFAMAPGIPNGFDAIVVAPDPSKPCAASRTDPTGIDWSNDDCTGRQPNHGRIPPPGTSLRSTGFAVTDNGVGWCIRVNTVNVATAWKPVGINVTKNDPNSNGHHLHALTWYEARDAADWAAGKWYRRGWLQPIANLDPGAIRMMNWDENGPGQMKIRFESVATASSYVGSSTFDIKQLTPYTETTIIAPSTLHVDGVNGTLASMQNGEIAFVRLGTLPKTGAHHPFNPTGNNGWGAPAINISIPAPGVIKYIDGWKDGKTYPHGFATGDTVQFYNSFNAGLAPRFRAYITTITVEDGTYCAAGDFTCFTFNFDTSGMCPGGASSCTLCDSTVACSATGCATALTCAMVSEAWMLQVGDGNDRVPYPVWVAHNSYNRMYGAAFAKNVFWPGYYARFCFNKSIAAGNDGLGNPRYGAWIDCSGLVAVGDPVPFELQAELIVELNALHPKYPINLYVNVPRMGLLPNEPDYTPEFDMPKNMVKNLMEGGHGFPGMLNNCPGCILIVKDSNETWETTAPIAASMAWRGFWPGDAAGHHMGCGTGNLTDFDTFSTLHAELVMQDIKTLGYPSDRIKYVLAGHGNYGTWGGINSNRISGLNLAGANCWPAWPGGDPATHAPMAYFDWFAGATYHGSSGASLTKTLAAAAPQWAADSVIYGPNSTQAQNDIQSFVSNYIVGVSKKIGTDYDNSIWAFQSFTDPCLIILLREGNSHAASLPDTNNYQGSRQCPPYSGVYNPPPFSGKSWINYEGGYGMTADAGNTTPILWLTCNSGIVTIRTNDLNNVAVGGYFKIFGADPPSYNIVYQAATKPDNWTLTAPIYGSICPNQKVRDTGVLLRSLSGAFQLSVDNSHQYGHALTDFFRTYRDPNAGLPAIYTIYGCGMWTLTCRDTYSSVNGVVTEGAGYFAPWSDLTTMDAEQP